MNKTEENSKIFGNKLAELIVEAHKASPKAYYNPILRLVRCIDIPHAYMHEGSTRVIRSGMTKLLTTFTRTLGHLESPLSSDEMEDIGFAFNFMMELFEGLDEYFETGQWEQIEEAIEKEGIRTMEL